MVAHAIGVCVPDEDHTWPLTPIDVRVSSEDLTRSLTFIRVWISGEDSINHRSTLVLYFSSRLHHDVFEKSAIKGRIMS